jgi:hypothetical protein
VIGILLIAAFVLGALAHEADRRRNAELDADAAPTEREYP